MVTQTSIYDLNPQFCALSFQNLCELSRFASKEQSKKRAFFGQLISPSMAGTKADKIWIWEVHFEKNVYFCSKILITMATKKEANEKKLVKEQTEALLKLLLLKTGTKRSDLIKLAEQDFIYENLGILTMAEKQQFNRLAL